MNDTKRCSTCKKRKMKDLFSFGFKGCDKCTEYPRRRTEEEDMLRPTTICNICNMRIKHFRRTEHICAERHKINITK